jgi:hypothetical protein
MQGGLWSEQSVYITSPHHQKFDHPTTLLLVTCSHDRACYAMLQSVAVLNAQRCYVRARRKTIANGARRHAAAEGKTKRASFHGCSGHHHTQGHQNVTPSPTGTTTTHLHWLAHTPRFHASNARSASPHARESGREMLWRLAFVRARRASESELYVAIENGRPMVMKHSTPQLLPPTHRSCCAVVDHLPNRNAHGSGHGCKHTQHGDPRAPIADTNLHCHHLLSFLVDRPCHLCVLTRARAHVTAQRIRAHSLALLMSVTGCMKEISRCLQHCAVSSCVCLILKFRKFRKVCLCVCAAVWPFVRVFLSPAAVASVVHCTLCAAFSSFGCAHDLQAHYTR